MFKDSGNVNGYKGSHSRHTKQAHSLSSSLDTSCNIFYSMPDVSVDHASKGEYTENSNRHRKGGHGQDALDYMNEHGIKYEINVEYNNGVRRGNIPNSKETMKQSGNTQSWFPKEWSANDIKNSAIAVSKTSKGTPKNGDRHTAIINGVSVTIIFGNEGQIKTAFPSNEQPGGIKNDK